MIDIAFVILQYGGFNDTKRCINSIITKIDTESFAIVVVDNSSPDSSCEDIENEIVSKGDSRLYLLKNSTNLGFAKGNNVGIDFARKELCARFIAVINNDTELVSYGIYSTIRRKYSESKTAVLGPLVLSGDGKYSSNPMGTHLFSETEIEHEIHHTQRVLKLNRYGLMGIYSVYKKIQSNKSICVDFLYAREEHSDVKLHGCFLIFTPAFFEKLTGFCPETFLYMEEDILLMEVLHNGMHSFYTPEICIFHKEGASTAGVKGKKRTDFVFSNRLKSQQIYKRKLLSLDNSAE